MNNDRINLIFDFLCKNRRYNKVLQEAFYSDVILSKKAIADKVIALLYQVANTQSKPNIDKLASFYKAIHSHKTELVSFKSFVDLLFQLAKKPFDGAYSYESVFKGLNQQNGWGLKTSALFVKSIYHLHNGDYHKDLMIWDDAPQKLFDSEHIYLPVDAVIEFIFSKLEISNAIGFTGINKYLKDLKCYNGELMEIWDDLWFWGFITQKGGGDNRVLGWNENKYWALLHTEKAPETIETIKDQANIFINLLNVTTKNRNSKMQPLFMP